MLRQSRQAAGLPQHFKDLISRKYTFVVGVTNSSFQDPRFRTYLVKTVSIDYHEKAFVANQNLLVQTPSQTTASTSSGSLALQITDPNALNNQVEMVTQITTLTNASVCTYILQIAIFMLAHILQSYVAIICFISLALSHSCQ